MVKLLFIDIKEDSNIEFYWLFFCSVNVHPNTFHPWSPSFLLVTSALFSEFKSLFSFVIVHYLSLSFYTPHTSEITQHLSFSLWFVSFNTDGMRINICLYTNIDI